MWHTLHNKPIDDLEEFILENTLEGETVYIGTDSSHHHTHTEFATIITIHKRGRGGRAIYEVERKPRVGSLRKKLFEEVWRSINLALEIEPICGGDIEIHIDASPEVRNASSKYIQALVGMVMGQGFKYKIKPDSWCATHVADHISRIFSGKRRRRKGLTAA